LGRLRDLMQVPALIDGRNFFAPEEVRQAGFSYVGMGRGRGIPCAHDLVVSSEARIAAPIWTGMETDFNG